MGWQCLLLAIICQILIDVNSKEITIQVNPKKLLQYVPERFLSITVDPGSILLAGNLENEALNMARGLSPSFARLGGKSTNYIKFGKELLMDNTTISEEQWDSVNNFARAAQMDLIASINPTERINGVWDSRDALQLISYSEKQGYNVAWQLGYDTEGISAPGAEVGRDVVRLRKIVDGFSRFTRSPIFAPDFPEIQTPKDAQFVRDLLIQAGPVLGAIFIQPPFKPEEDPAQTIMNTILNMESNIWGKAMRLGRIIPRKPIWIAEREISKGTSEDAIALVKRLGVSARIGIQVFMRQVGPESLKTPTPEYWMALMYKNLVGRGVLDARVNSGQNRTELHIFAHCAQSLPIDRSIIDAGVVYDKGAVTVFGVNEGAHSHKISLKVGMKEERVHVYSLTFSDDTNKKNEDTYMNGQMLTLSPEGELPIVSPRIVERPSRAGIIIPARSVFFFVLPDVKSRVCSSTSTLPQEVQDLSRKLIQVAAEVLDKPVGLLHLQGDQEEEPGKVYVKFGRNIGNRVGMPYPNNQMKTTTDNVNMVKADEMTTKPTLTPQQNDIENSTGEAQENKTNVTSRRKRSPDNGYSNADMEVAATNDDYIPSQEEIVKYLNSFSSALYEKFHKNGKRDAGNEEEVYQILPKELINTMKKMKLTFKPLGTSTDEEKEIADEPNTIKPLTDSDSIDTETTDSISTDADQQSEVEETSEGKIDLENYDENVSEPVVNKDNAVTVSEEGVTPNNYDELEPDVKQAEKEAIIPDNSEAEVNNLDEKDNFREQNEDQLVASKGAESFQESDIGSEADSALESSSSSQDKPNETIQTDELVRESDSPLEAPSDGAASAEDSTDITNVGREVVNADEPSKDYGSFEGVQSAPYSVPGTDTPSPSKITSENYKETPEESEQSEKTDGDKQGYSIQDPATLTPTDEGLREDKQLFQNAITTSELPEVIAIDGIGQDKLDELLLNLADNKLDDKGLLKQDDNNLESNDIQNRDHSHSENDNQGNTDKEDLTSINKTSQPESESIKKDEGFEKDKELIDSACTAKIEASDDPEGLNNGPTIPTSNSIETIKMPRDVIPEPTKLLANSMAGKPVLMLLDPSAKLTDLKANNKRELEETVDDADDDGDDSEKIESDDKTSNEEVNDDTEETNGKQLSVASFKDVPLQEGEDKSYNPTEKSSDVNDNTEDTELGDKEPTEDTPESTSLESLQNPEVPSSNLESNKETIKEESKGDEKEIDAVSMRLKAQKVRHEKLMAIRSKILETRKKFRALANEDNWRLALQKREEEMRSLLNQEKELRKRSHALSAPQDTLLSRTRRLTYYPEDDDISNEDIYDYETDKLYQKKTDSCNLPLTVDDGKLYLNQNVLANSLRDNRNHVIFPLDNKPQAVVLNNRIIPAKLYGVVNIYDDPSSKSDYEKTSLEPLNESFFQKYYTKSYDPPAPRYNPPAPKYNLPAPQISPIKSFESLPIPKDAYVKRIDDSSNFLPVVVFSPETTGLRRRRSPIALLDNQFHNERKYFPYKDHTIRKRSTSPLTTRTKKSINDISKETEIISNEIRPENYKTSKVYSDFSYPNNFMGTYELGAMEGGPWPIGEQAKEPEGRTFALPSLFPPQVPPPLPFQQNFIPENMQPPPLHRTFPPEPLPPPHRTFPPEPLPPSEDFQSLPEPFLSPSQAEKEEKHAQPSQAYFFNIVQDKFKSLMGMLETLALWCGANTSK